MPSGLALVGVTTSSTGVLMTTYRPAGAIRKGSFALGEPTEAEVQRRAKMAREDGGTVR